MNEQNFDNQLRDSLGDYRSKLDTNALWKQLEPQLAADKKRRRGIFWWWTSIGVLALVLVAGGYLIQDHQSLAAAKKALEQQPVQAQENPETTTTGSTTDAATAEKAIAPTEAIAAPAEVPVPAMESGSATIHTSEKETVKTAPQRQTHIQRKAETALGLNRSLQQAASPKQGNRRPSTTQPPYNTTTTSSITTDLSPATKPVASASNSAMNKPEMMDPVMPQPDETNVSTSAIPAISAVQPLVLSPWQEIRSNMLATPEAFPPLVPVKKPAVAKKHTDLLVRPNFEMGYATRTLAIRNTGDSLVSPLEQLHVREATEKTMEYLHGNLLLGARHHSGWYALTGLGYTRITEQFAFSTTRSEIDSVSGITELYIDAQGDTTFTEGLVARTRHITYRKRTYSSYTLLDVPLIVGYDWEKGPWSFGAEAGVFFNISLKAEGDVFSGEENFFVRLENTSWFKSNIGMSYYGSVRVGYALGEKTRVSLGPVFRYIPDISNPDTNELSQKYGLLGLNLGIARRF